MMLALFDFDGTLTTKDSLPDFIKYAVGASSYYFGLLMLSPFLIAYVFKLIPNDIAKEKLIAHFFKGWEYLNFQHIADTYALEQIDKIIRASVMKRLNWHQDQGHKVVIVSASIECWLEQWCKKQHIELIATRLEIIDGKLTGRFATSNCHGEEKVRRIKERYNLAEFDYIYAYGDTKADSAMLAMADEAYYRHDE